MKYEQIIRAALTMPNNIATQSSHFLEVNQEEYEHATELLDMIETAMPERGNLESWEHSFRQPEQRQGVDLRCGIERV